MEVRRLPSDALEHHGVKGQHWGERRWQNEDGSLTAAGRLHYGYKLAKRVAKVGKENALTYRGGDRENIIYIRGQKSFKKIKNDFDNSNSELIKKIDDSHRQYAIDREKNNKKANEITNKKLGRKLLDSKNDKELDKYLNFGLKTYKKLMKESGWTDKKISDIKKSEQQLSKKASEYIDSIMNNEFGDKPIRMNTGSSINLKTGEFSKATPKTYTAALLYGPHTKFSNR